MYSYAQKIILFYSASAICHIVTAWQGITLHIKQTTRLKNKAYFHAMVVLETKELDFHGSNII